MSPVLFCGKGLDGRSVPFHGCSPQTDLKHANVCFLFMLLPLRWSKSSSRHTSPHAVDFPLTFLTIDPRIKTFYSFVSLTFFQYLLPALSHMCVPYALLLCLYCPSFQFSCSPCKFMFLENVSGIWFLFALSSGSCASVICGSVNVGGQPTCIGAERPPPCAEDKWLVLLTDPITKHARSIF